MKYNDNGTYKDIYVKAFDTLPVGSIVNYDGQTAPDNYQEVSENDLLATTSTSGLMSASDKSKLDNLEYYESSGGEILIGKWGIADLYRRVIYVDSLPNHTTKNIALPSEIDVNKVANVRGIARKNNYRFPLPYASASNYNIELAITDNGITIVTASDRSDMNAIIIIDYIH